ncbi:MAG: MFS transporter [Candidatus Bathyarchaeia archaeon]
MFEEYKRLPYEANCLIWSSLFPNIAHGMFYTDLPYFLVNVQGLSPVLMGIIVGAMGIATVAASIPLGIAADKYGRKRLLIVGNGMASVTIAVFVLTLDFTILLAAAIFKGISEAAFAASTNALLAEKIESKRRTGAFSLLGFVQSTAFGVGGVLIYSVSPLEGLGLNSLQSHAVLYLFLAVLSLSSIILMLRLTESTCLKRDASLRNLLPTKSKGILGKYLLAGGLVAFGAGMVVPLMTYWFGLRYGLTDAIGGPILGVSSIAIGAATLVSPAIARRLGLVKAITVTQAFSMLFMVATPFSPEYISASFIYTIRAFLMNMASPLQQSMMMGLVPEDERGAASGISSALWQLPNSLSTPIGSSLMGMGLLAKPFLLAGAFYVVSIALFWIFFRRARLPEEHA